MQGSLIATTYLFKSSYNAYDGPLPGTPRHEQHSEPFGLKGPVSLGCD